MQHFARKTGEVHLGFSKSTPLEETLRAALKRCKYQVLTYVCHADHICLSSFEPSTPVTWSKSVTMLNELNCFSDDDSFVKFQQYIYD